MNLQIPQDYFNRLMRAIVEFQMIADGDKIAIGLSGGKDSVFLSYALAALRERLPKKFSLFAITIDPKFTGHFDTSRLEKFCKDLSIPFHARIVDIAGILKAQNDKEPCYTCAFFRRGAVNRLAKEIGCNKVAYAHHHDDAVETFLMNLLYSGQLKTFLPATYLSRNHLTVIRPLVYFREFELAEAASIHGFAPLKNPCPFDGATKRQEIKELLEKLRESIPACYEHLGAAMRRSNPELWPAPKSRGEMKPLYRNFISPRE